MKLLDNYQHVSDVLDTMQESFSSYDEEELNKFVWNLRYAWREDSKKKLSYFVFEHIQSQLKALVLSKKHGVSFRPNDNIGSVFSNSMFINDVENELLSDYDGFGYFSCDEFVSDVVIRPSDITNVNYQMPEWATAIIWYNK